MTTEGRPTIALLGDVMLGRKVAEAPPETVWSDEVAALCGARDAVVCNLECCVSEHDERTIESAASRSSSALRRQRRTHSRPVGVTAVSLANNHALDFGSVALLDTLDHLAAASIAAAGAGPDVDRARRGAVLPAGGVRLGLLAATDHGGVRRRAGLTGRGLRRSARGAPGMDPHRAGTTRSRGGRRRRLPHWGPNMTSEPAGWQRGRGRASWSRRCRSRCRALGWHLPRHRVDRRPRGSLRPEAPSTTTSTRGCGTTWDRRPLAPARRAPARAGGARAPLL